MNNGIRVGAPILKRVVACLLIMLIFAALTGCGKPRGMSDSNYQKCKQLIEVYDAYLDFKIDGKTAGEKITKISSTMDDESTVIGGYYSQSGKSKGAIMTLYDDPSMALEARNELAEGVGLPKR